MKRAAAAWLVIGIFAGAATADRVVLKNGRVIEGKVTEADGKVLIELAYGVVSYPSSEVAGIERMPTPAEVVEWRLAQIDRSDPDALFEVAEWAADNDLPQRAERLCREVLALKPDHPGARRRLGYVRAGGKWLTLPKALELAASKLAAGRHEELLAALLPAIREVVSEPKHLRELKRIEAHCRLRGGQFDLALKAFRLLAERAPLPGSVRYASIADVLEAHPDGMYLVTEMGPLGASLYGPAAGVRNGPGSLADPKVLAVALRDRASAATGKARALMGEAKALEQTDPQAAQARYARAARHLRRADAIVPDIARSYRVEIARRRIRILNHRFEAQAKVFDELKGKLGELPPAKYKAHVQDMLRTLNGMAADLNAVLEVAAPFRDDLPLDVVDARYRLQRVNALREILKREYDAM